MPIEAEYGATGELRFAVVLYGGVSLAIYMNGIVQELLALVRATAPDPDTHDGLHITELTGVEEVYRELGQRLNVAQRTVLATSGGPVLTRFVVDLITGSSAGGINGVFLAKALANDQSISALSRLWVAEGDIAMLVNDTAAMDGLNGLPLETPPQSLLSGQRMLFKLVQAMRTVSAIPEAQVSPYADAIDLWITTTDLRGRVEAIDITTPDLRDDVYERKYRTTFHFVYERDDVGGGIPSMFAARYDPLLAFAARCTSSFPAAFPPAQLADLADLAARVRTTSDGKPLPAILWDAGDMHVRSLFQKYGDDPLHYQNVSFADGGYLDNQPVDLILNTLPKRRASIPVSRRVLIVDPDPGAEPRADENPIATRVDLRSTLIKVVSLPRQQTIGEDVARIRALREPAAVRRAIYDAVDASVATGVSGADRSTPSAVAYRELRQLQQIRDFASALARVAYPDRSYDDDSPQYRILVTLLTSWKRSDPTRFTARFAEVDLAYELRRINFVQSQIDKAMRDPGITDDAFNGGVAVRWVLDAQYQVLARAGRELRYRVGNPAEAQLGPLRSALADLKQTIDPALTDQPTVVMSAQQALDAVLEAFNRQSVEVLTRAHAAISETLKNNPDLEAYRRGWNNFAAYDEATYSLQQLLPGENEDIAVYRVSPREATAIVDERAIHKSKLAGVQVHHFGAFFAADWRRNDILWGRLDGAERIIVAVWPEGADMAERDKLVNKAHRAIVGDVLADNEYRKLLSRLLAPGDEIPPELAPGTTVPESEISAVLNGLRTHYTTPPPPDPASTLKLAARAARVTGGIGRGLSHGQTNPLNRVLGWAGRGFQALAILIEVATGDGPKGYLARRALELAVLVSIFIVILGIWLGRGGVLAFGLAVLAVGLGLEVVVRRIRALARHKR